MGTSWIKISKRLKIRWRKWQKNWERNGRTSTQLIRCLDSHMKKKINKKQSTKNINNQRKWIPLPSMALPSLYKSRAHYSRSAKISLKWVKRSLLTPPLSILFGRRGQRSLSWLMRRQSEKRSISATVRRTETSLLGQIRSSSRLIRGVSAVASTGRSRNKSRNSSPRRYRMMQPTW